jgi:hypothetical protein
MSRRMFKVLILGAMAVSALASASAASASTWTTSAGGTNFTATAPASLLIVQAPTVTGINCTTTRATGSVLAGGTGNPYAVATVTPIFTGCSIGINSASVSCSAATLYASSYAAPVVTGFIGRISCTIVGAGCTVTVISTGPSPTFHGVDGTYNNTTGVLTVRGGSPSTQTLTASWDTRSGSPCNTLFGTRAGDPNPSTARAYFGDRRQTVRNFPDDLVYTVTSTPLPRITGV